MPILPKSLTVIHSAADCLDSVNLERVQFLAPLTVQFLQVQKLEYTQHACEVGKAQPVRSTCMRGFGAERRRHWAPGLSGQPHAALTSARMRFARRAG